MGDAEVQIINGISRKKCGCAIGSTDNKILNVLVFEYDSASYLIIPRSRPLLRNSKSDGAFILISNASRDPLFDSIIIKISSLALSYRLAVKINFEPIKRSVDIVNQFRLAELCICVLHAENQLPT